MKLAGSSHTKKFWKRHAHFIMLSSCMWVLFPRLKKEVVPRKRMNFFSYSRATAKAKCWHLSLLYGSCSDLSPH